MTSPIADASAANNAMSAAISIFDIADPHLTNALALPRQREIHALFATSSTTLYVAAAHSDRPAR